MKTEITLCDLCEAPIVGPGMARSMHGVCVMLGYSVGGWGSRKNFVEWSGEVCDVCFAEYETIARAFQLWLRKRDGIRAPEIVIRERDVSCVQEDKPASGGCEAQLLRPLPFVHRRLEG